MRLITWLVVTLVLAVVGMGVIHGIQTYQAPRDVSQMDALWERQVLAQNLNLTLEKYRRQSGSFRKLTEAQIAAAKAELRKEIDHGSDRLDQLDPSPEEKAMTARLRAQLDDFFVLSAKLEPMLFLRDVYLKPEAQKAHEGMRRTLESLGESAQSRAETMRSEARERRLRMGRLYAGAGVGVLILSPFLLLGVFMIYIRPLRRLLARTRDVRAGKLRVDASAHAGPPLRGHYAEIEAAIEELAAQVDRQQRDRQAFVTAVATDLRVPLVPLQTSATLLATATDKLTADQRVETAEVVRRSAVRLSRTLDDLTDTLSLEQGLIRLDERIVDVRDVAQGAVRVLAGPGSSYEIRTFMPNGPLFVFADPARLERVLINLMSKVMQYAPQGGRIDLAVSRRIRAGAPAGVEIVCHEAGNEVSGPEDLITGSSKSMLRASGPETDLLRHWVSENGFGLTLAQKIVEVHGGTVTAAGLAGTSVVLTLRLPEERVATSTPGARPGFLTAMGADQSFGNRGLQELPSSV